MRINFSLNLLNVDFKGSKNKIINSTNKKIDKIIKKLSPLAKFTKGVAKETVYVGKWAALYPAFLGAAIKKGIQSVQGLEKTESNKTYDKDTNCVFIFVHGWAHNSSAAHTVAKKLREKGPLYKPELGLGQFGDIEKSAEKLGEIVSQAKKKHPNREVVLIGHSMGGLVCSQYASKNPGAVKGVITLGSPFHGAKTGGIGGVFSKSARQMKKGSKFLKDLELAVMNDSKTKYVHFGGGVDQVLFSQKSALMRGHENYYYEDLGHAGMAFAPKVARKVQKVVDNL